MLDLTGYSRPAVWCGPASLSILVGAPVRETTEVLTRIVGGPYEALEGTYPEHMAIALHEYGYQMRAIDVQALYPHLTHGPHLRAFVADLLPEFVVQPMLIGLHRHWVTSRWRMIADNQSNGRAQHVDDTTHAKKQVKQAWAILHK